MEIGSARYAKGWCLPEQPRRQEDWTCPKCKGTVFARKTRCRCGGTRDGEESKASPVKRSGDWECPKCKELVFSTRSECRKCHEPKPSPEQSDSNCVVCLENEPTHLFKDCGHLCVCGTCVMGLENKCPVCRQVSAPMRVFRS